MTLSKNNIEITSPVGSYDSLHAAINAGAGSVYFGVENLNMRSRSSANFGLDDLKKISSICKENNVRNYITLNTVMYDSDLKSMRNIIDTAKISGTDAIIASDHAAIEYANKIGVQVHISTQLSISNLESVKFYSKVADAIVLARELSLDQIKFISESIYKENICGPSGKLLRLEVFVHGALCMAISGKCFISLHNHNASANRGACYQSCRREYSVTDDIGHELTLENNYIMSTKDLCTIGFLDKIIHAGVKILKIEGRGRSPEYVSKTTSIYHEALKSIDEGNFTQEKVKSWKVELEKVFNRGFWNGHYLGNTLSNWNTNTYGSKAMERKTYIGKGIKYFKKIKVGEFLLETGELKVGDKILITGPTTGALECRVDELRVDEKNVEIVRKGEKFSLPVAEIIRNSDKLFRIDSKKDK